jgi:hypothetical protein
MFTLLPTPERFTAKNSDKDNTDFLSDKAVLSLISDLLKSVDLSENQRLISRPTSISWYRDFAETESHLPVEYENNDILHFFRDYYISRLKLKLHQSKIQENIRLIQEIPSQIAIDDLITKNSSVNHQNQELKITQERLIELLQEEDEDEYGILKPTPYAFEKAWNLTLDASQFMKNSFKRASVSTDDEGGIRLTWTCLEPEAEVRLICPSEPNKQIYLYQEKNSHYGVVKDVSGFTLASWLHWLNQV